MPKKYDNDFIISCVAAYRGGKRASQICAETNVSKNTLYYWIKKLAPIPADDDFELAAHKYVTLTQHTAHLEELLAVSRVCKCGAAASTIEKLKATETLRGLFSLRAICEYLELPRSTFYNYMKSKSIEKQTTQVDAFYRPLVEEWFKKSNERFGANTIRKKLKHSGYAVSAKRIRHIMQELKLVPIRQRETKFSYNPSSTWRKNLLRRQFKQSEPNKVWVSDFTYICVNAKQYYFCVVIDLFSRKVIGYTLTDTCDANMVITAAKKGFTNRGDPAGVMFHTDLGTQYTAYDFFRILREYQAKQSFSRPGVPLDNAVAESFFASFKKEDLYHREFSTYEELKAGIEDYVNFYNRIRPHKSNGFRSPDEYEADFFESQTIKGV